MGVATFYVLKCGFYNKRNIRWPCYMGVAYLCKATIYIYVLFWLHE